MRKFSVMLIAMALLFGMVSVSNALLIDRGGGLIYDTEQDLTWLQDTNYAMTSGYHSDGRMTWYEAMDWVENLVYAGCDNWRLPAGLDAHHGILFFPDPDHELGNLYRQLGNEQSQVSPNCGPFLNFPTVYSDKFWLGQTHWEVDTIAIYYRWYDSPTIDSGYLGIEPKNTYGRAWAVADGDIAALVPELAIIDIDPDTLNLKSKGKWVTCYIELPEEYDVADIDVSTVAITSISAIGGDATEVNIPAEPFPTEIGDYNNNGILDLMVKFDRQLVQDVVPVGAVEITVSGSTLGEVDFQGTDTLLIIDKGREHIDDKNHGSVVY